MVVRGPAGKLSVETVVLRLAELPVSLGGKFEAPLLIALPETTAVVRIDSSLEDPVLTD